MAAGRGSGEERDPPPTLVEQMLRALKAAVEIVGRDEVVLNRAGEAAEVAFDQDDLEPGFTARRGEMPRPAGRPRPCIATA